MPQVIDLVGRIFGRLTVIEYAGRYKRRTRWQCRCDCGNISRYDGGNLQQGATTKCKQCRYKFFDRASHRRRSIKLRYKGRTQTIKEWSKELDLPVSTIRSRYDHGHPPRKILSTDLLPQPPQGTMITFRGVTLPLKQWADKLGISRQALKRRLVNWPKREALTRPNTWS